MAILKPRVPKFFIAMIAVTVMNAMVLGINTKPITNGSIVDSIKNSLVGTVHAESEFFSTSLPNGTGCWNASFTNNLAPCPIPVDEVINICIKENTTYGLPVFYYVSNNVPADSFIPVLLINPIIAEGPPVGLGINPVLQSTTSPYLTDFSRLNHLVNLTAPAVPFVSSPTLTTLTFDGNFSVQTGGGQPRNLSHNVAANVRLEHVNTGPVLTNLTPASYNQTLSGGSSVINLSVSAQYTDNESNHSNVTFELSNDNFSTILQAQTFNAVASGTTLNKTFTNLGVGKYQWRVRATETDALGNCIGYPNQDPAVNLSVTAGPQNIVLTSGTLAPTGGDVQTPLALAILTILGGIAILFKIFLGKIKKEPKKY